MAESRTQPDYRRNMVNTDRFGRKWLVTIELKTGDPTGLITPTNWTDPLGTPQKYLQVPRDEPRTLRIQFTRWIEDLKRDHRDWTQQLHRIGQMLYDTQYDESKPPTRRMLELIGPKPLDIRLLERAARGDRALLGFEPLKLKDARALGRDPAELERQRQLAKELGEQAPAEGEGITTPSGEAIVDGFTVPANDSEEED
jgi:hypothetical protein